MLEKDFILNTISRFLSVSAMAALASFGVHADEAVASRYALKFETHRTRAKARRPKCQSRANSRQTPSLDAAMRVARSTWRGAGSITAWLSCTPAVRGSSRKWLYSRPAMRWMPCSITRP